MSSTDALRSAADDRKAAVAFGARGAVAAGHGLAVDAAMDVLRTGGNSIDAAVAGAAVQCVVEMPWCGLGGDVFALVRTPDGTVCALNGSGAAPEHIGLAAAGVAKIGRYGPLAMVVPGAVDAWAQLLERFGTRSMADSVAAAAALAEDGFAFDARLRRAFDELPPDEGLASLRALADGIEPGSPFRQPDLAATLRAIAEQGRDGFYRGGVAERIAETVQAGGGALDTADLAAHEGEWCTPMTAFYREVEVSTQPPVSMGVLLLAGLRAVEDAFPEGLPPSLTELTDRLVAVKHRLFRELLPQLGDPRHASVEAGEVLRAAGRTPSRRAGEVLAPSGEHTTTLSVTDDRGWTVSLIHSLFNEFGARVLVPGTGVVLNDRLANVVNKPALPNGLRGGRRPMHTLHSWIASFPDGRVLAGATPGGRGQVQTNLQVLLNIVDRLDDPASAIDRPRWVNGMPRRAPDDDTLYLEGDFDRDAAAELAGRGHRVEVMAGDADDHFGACTLVERRNDGTVAAFADRRRGGAAGAW